MDRTLWWVGQPGDPSAYDNFAADLLGTLDVYIPPVWTANYEFGYPNWFDAATRRKVSVLPTAGDTLVFAKNLSTGNPTTSFDWNVKAIQFDFGPNEVTLDSTGPGATLANLTLNGPEPIFFNKIGVNATINFNVRLDADTATVDYGGLPRYSYDNLNANQLTINGAFVGQNVTFDGTTAFSIGTPSVTLNTPAFVTTGNLTLRQGNVTINAVTAVTRAVELENTTLSLRRPLALASLSTSAANGLSIIRDTGDRLSSLQLQSSSSIVAKGELQIGMPIFGNLLSIDSPGGTVVFNGYAGATANNSVLSTTVNDGTLVLDRTPGSSLVGNSLNVAANARLISRQGEQINDAAPVTLNAGSIWSIGGTNLTETIGSLSLTDASIELLTSGGNTLPRANLKLPQAPTLVGNVSIDANLNIGANPFNLNVAAGKQISLNGRLEGTAINKSGPGTLVIGPGSSTLISDLTLSGGPTRIEASGFLNSGTNLSLIETTLALIGGDQRLNTLYLQNAVLDDEGTGNRAKLRLNDSRMQFAGSNLLKVDLVNNGLHQFTVQNGGDLTYSGNIPGFGLLKLGAGSLTFNSADVAGTFDAREGSVVLRGNTSFGQLYVEPTVSMTIATGVYDIDWLVAQQNLTFAQPTKFGRVSPTSGKRVTATGIDLRNSDIVLDDVGQLVIGNNSNLKSVTVSSGDLRVSNQTITDALVFTGGSGVGSAVQTRKFDTSSAASFRADGAMNVGFGTTRENSSLSGALSGAGAWTFQNANVQFNTGLVNTATGSMTFVDSEVYVSNPVSGYALNGPTTLKQTLLAVNGARPINPTATLALESSYWLSPYATTVKSLSLDQSQLNVSAATGEPYGLVVTNGLTVTNGSGVSAASADIAGGLTVTGPSTVRMAGQVAGTSLIGSEATLDATAFPLPLVFAGPTSFESDATLKFLLTDSTTHTAFDFNGPTLIGTPIASLGTASGMDGSVVIDVSTFPTTLPIGRYDLMDFTDAGYRAPFTFNTIYPKLENFVLQQPSGGLGHLEMNGRVLQYVVNVPEPTVFMLLLPAAAFLRRRGRGSL